MRIVVRLSSCVNVPVAIATSACVYAQQAKQANVHKCMRVHLNVDVLAFRFLSTIGGEADQTRKRPGELHGSPLRL